MRCRLVAGPLLMRGSPDLRFVGHAAVFTALRFRFPLSGVSLSPFPLSLPLELSPAVDLRLAGSFSVLIVRVSQLRTLLRNRVPGHVHAVPADRLWQGDGRTSRL